MKSKVTVVKDEAFTKRRMRVIERFFNAILNDPLFDPDRNKEI